MKKVYGLTSVLMGAIGSDGGMGTTLTEVLGATVKDTAKLTFTAPTTEDVEIEESDDPFDTITTENGGWQLDMESYNLAAKALSDTMGGTYTAGTSGAPDTWESPSTNILLERSVRVTTRNGVIIDIPRMKINAAPDFTFAKGSLGRLVVTGKVLKPTKANTSSIKLTDGN